MELLMILTYTELSPSSTLRMTHPESSRWLRAQVALYMPYAHHFAIIANADLAGLRIYGRTLILRWIKVLQGAEARGNRQDL